jgi:hypothetical protein
MRRAARFADAVVVDSIRSPAETESLLDIYKAECDRVGRNPVAVVMRRIWIGDRDFAHRQMAKATEDYRDGVVREGDAPWLPHPDNTAHAAADRDEVMILGDPLEAAQRLTELSVRLGTEWFILKLPFILEVPERAVILDQLAAIGEVVRRLRPSH